MDLIHDTEQIKMFFDTVLPSEWKETEAAFISLAARRKYILEGMRIDLGQRPQMLDRDTVKRRSFAEYIAKLRRFTAPCSYTDENGDAIPVEVMAVYVNIHLSDAVKAWNKTKQEIARIDEEAAAHLFSGGGDLGHISRQMRNLGGIWLTQMQNSYSRKSWMDFDVDLIDTFYREEAYGKSMEILAGMGLSGTMAIMTRGGFHLLLPTDRNAFSRDVNPKTILEKLSAGLSDISKETVINKNGMVPLPGTMQGGYPVRFADKEQI